MSDSRFAASRHFVKSHWPFGVKASLFISVVSSSFLLGFWVSGDDWTDQSTYALILLFTATGLWLSEAIPPFAVGLLIIGVCVLALSSPILNDHPIAYTEFTQTLSSPVIWLILGGFFLAQSMQKAGYDAYIFSFTIKLFGTKPTFVLLGMMLTTWFASSILSNTASTAMMLASVLPFLRQFDKNAPIVKSIFLGIPTAAALGGITTIIGSPPNAIAVGFAEQAGYSISFPEWVLYGTVPSILLLFISWFILLKIYPPTIDHLEIKLPNRSESNPMSLGLRKFVLLTLLITLGLWFTAPFHSIPITATAFIPIVLLTVSGVIDANDFNSMPWDTLILISGGLALGVAMTESGLVVIIADSLKSFQYSDLIIITVICFITVLLSNVMSNTSAATVLLPIALELLPEQGLLVATSVGLSASFAILLPVSTPPNAIAYSYGFLQQKDFRPLGIWIGIIGPPVVIGWLLLLNSWT